MLQISGDGVAEGAAASCDWPQKATAALVPAVAYQGVSHKGVRELPLLATVVLTVLRILALAVSE